MSSILDLPPIDETFTSGLLRLTGGYLYLKQLGVKVEKTVCAVDFSADMEITKLKNRPEG